MSSLAPHPARSPEFLSRLRDGDLTPAERAQFESHRAHCVECRRAAADFDAALALFRSSHPRPAAADLSSRILRKLQAGNVRRSPFGVSFGIDLRWAGAFAAALIAVIIGSSVVLRREAADRRLGSETAPIPVIIKQEKAPGEAAADKTVAAESEEGATRAAGAPPPAKKGFFEEKDSVARGLPKAAAASSPAAPAFAGEPANADLLEKESQRRDTAKEIASNRSSAPRSEAPRQAYQAEGVARTQERSGGEGAQQQQYKESTDTGILRLRLKILPADGGGTAPALVEGADIDLPVSMRGQEFTLVVEAGGRVREVRPLEAKLGKRAKVTEERLRAQALREDEKAESHLQPLRGLRFEPSDRARILRVRVE